MSIPQFREISEADFAATESARRLFAHEDARRFASFSVSNGVGSLAISWRSDLIEPSIVVDGENPEVIWVAADDRVAAVNKNGQIVFSIATTTPLLSLEKFSGGIVAISELQAFVINHNCSIKKIVDFPDIPQDYKVSDDRLRVDFAGDSPMEYPL